MRTLGKAGRAWVVALALTAGAGPALLGPAAASASALPAQAATVLAASASPAQLAAAGGTVTVTGRVANATSCQLQLLSSPSFAVVYSHDPKSCTGGTYSARVTVAPNPTTAPVTVGFALVARGSASSSSGRFYVVLAGAAPAAVLSVTATPAQLPKTGGAVSVTARVANATSCQLQLLSSQSFAVVYSHDPKDCSGELTRPGSSSAPTPPPWPAPSPSLSWPAMPPPALALRPGCTWPWRRAPGADGHQHVRSSHHHGPSDGTAGAGQT